MKKIKLKFTLPIEPKAKMRHRMTKTGKAFTPKEMVDWETSCRLLLSEHIKEVIVDPVRVDACFILKRPANMRARWKSNRNGHVKGEYKFYPGLIWHTKRPDVDNLKKSLLDALNMFLNDDAQVCFGRVMKCYSEVNKPPRIIVTITNKLWRPIRRLESMGMV